MAMLFKRENSYGYMKMDKEDPEEKKRREAQFLIYKTLKQADQVTMVRRSSSSSSNSSSSSRSNSWLKLRICKLKVKIGKRLMKLRKTMLSNMNKTKVHVCKHVMGQLKNLKRLFNGKRSGANAISHLPQPLFTT